MYIHMYVYNTRIFLVSFLLDLGLAGYVSQYLGASDWVLNFRSCLKDDVLVHPGRRPPRLSEIWPGSYQDRVLL